MLLLLQSKVEGNEWLVVFRVEFCRYIPGVVWCLCSLKTWLMEDWTIVASTDKRRAWMIMLNTRVLDHRNREIYRVPDYNDWDFTPIILISASASSDIYRQKTSSEFSWNYIAGAGDDEESWARGLTPVLFWNNVYDIISSGPDVCNQTVANIVEKDRVFRSQRGQNAPQVSVKPKKSESTWSNQSQDQPLDIIVENGISGDLLDSEHGVYWLGLTNLAVCSTKYNFKSSNVESILNCDKNQILCTLEDSEAYLHLPVMDSKYDRFSLQRNLPSALNFAELHLKKGKRLAVCCNSGAYDDGKFFKDARITKIDMRQQLVFVCKYIVNARPSRGNLKQVYNFLAAQSILT
ncbi:hypothetical protein E3N88_09468 [Mikania micrantha]|uniref:Rit1 N-terminal domain-containing protein n=1 Tax=Mikania micrantha TaxID=192012 RepID=A0A5N6PJU2_9ASTR|nr:hypothetical protein E3N88_09468 [Mikania micrantha]